MIYTIAIFFVISLIVGIIWAYKLISYQRINGITSISMTDMFSNFSKIINSPTLPFLGLLGDILMYQVKIWYLYLIVVFLVYCMLASDTKDDYKSVEYGSAKWAEKEDYNLFKQKDSSIPVGKNFYIAIKPTTKKIVYSPHNLNEIVIAGPGCGKTFRKIKPDVMQMFGSYVVTDPKGELFRDTYKLMINSGYKVRVLNLIDITSSNSYNPFKYMTSEQDVVDIADLFIKTTLEDGEKPDFWVTAAKKLLTAVLCYLFKAEKEIKSLGRVFRLVNTLSFDANGTINEFCEINVLMKKHKTQHPYDFASISWEGLNGAAQETLSSIKEVLLTKLQLWGIQSVDSLTENDEMDFDDVGVHKTIIYLIIPTPRNPYKVITNMFYVQLYQRLMLVANKDYNGRLPLLVSCEMDEFANTGKIPDFNEVLSVVRSFNIRICIVLQSLSQLKNLYDKQYDGIIGNCSIFTYLGTNDTETRKYVVERLGKTTVRVDTRSYNRGNQSGGSDNSSYVGRDLLTTDELAQAVQAKGKSKRYGGSLICFIDEFRPFYTYKFDTKNHPVYSQVGGSFPDCLHNNTDILKLFADKQQNVALEYKEKREAERLVYEIEKKSYEKQKTDGSVEIVENIKSDILDGEDYNPVSEKLKNVVTEDTFEGYYDDEDFDDSYIF